ncbi:hypothetical protein E4U42_005783 [Claviceps africana]|uniref:Uncharacterized protein n=1 Tax=Claviceps africana TaxID=83212 RepID=A0A8K0J384_9HYPO|nr:hypothetical protein E4U42_005783 [Claviceps africana]
MRCEDVEAFAVPVTPYNCYCCDSVSQYQHARAATWDSGQPAKSPGHPTLRM